MKVIIAGSRCFEDRRSDLLVQYAIIQSEFDITEVISGTARGIDRAGESWASNHMVSVKQFPANWALHKKAAGPIRNKEMAKYADAAIIVWDGESTGTANMIQCMVTEKKPYYLMVVEELHESGDN